jgi:CRISPR-associated protein Cmr2
VGRPQPRGQPTTHQGPVEFVTPVSAPAGHDLLIFALPGVQRFIEESRSTSDLRSASEIVAALASRAAVCCQQYGGDLVIPPLEGRESDVSGGVTNRVVALVPAGVGRQIAQDVRAAVEANWTDWVCQALGASRPAPATPGFPGLVWVCVAADGAGYRRQWERAQLLLAGRKQVDAFAPRSSAGICAC